MTREERTERGSIDPTRWTRLSEAIGLMQPYVAELRSLIERVLRGDHTAENLLKAALSAAYEKADDVITAVGLKILSRGPEYTALNDPERGAGLKVKGELALAAPRDYPDTLLCWEPRFEIAFGPDVSEQELWHYVRRHWLFEKLRLPTEADAHPIDWIACVRFPPAEAPPTRTRR